MKTTEEAQAEGDEEDLESGGRLSYCSVEGGGSTISHYNLRRKYLPGGGSVRGAGRQHPGGGESPQSSRASDASCTTPFLRPQDSCIRDNVIQRQGAIKPSTSLPQLDIIHRLEQGTSKDNFVLNS